MTDRVQIAAPDFSGAGIPRRRLVQDLTEMLPRKLILVIAPPGYGKTTFLAEFAEASGIPVCWAQLTFEERDPAKLHELLAQSVTRRFRRLKGELSEEGSGLSGVGIGRALAEHVPERHVLVLDDVQILKQSPEATAYLESLRRSLPDQTTLILAGRSLPGLSLAALVAADEVKSYGAVELTLDFEEMLELVELRTGEEMDDEAAQELYRQTEGWIMGVVLSERMQPGYMTAGLDRSLVAEYFEELVFAQEPAEIQQFLVETAHLPVFNAELCDHALERVDCQTLINQLLKSGSYVFREGYYPEPFYRYKRQFSHFLRSKERLSERKAETIAKRAAEWYEQHELPEFAFDLWMGVQDYEAAGKVADQWARPIYVRGNPSQIYEWAEKLRQAEAITPEVLRALAVCVIYGGGDQQSASDTLDRAYQLAIEEGDPKVIFRILSTRFLIQLEFGASENLKQLLDEMREILPVSTGDDLGIYLTNMLSYRIYEQKDIVDELGLLPMIEENVRSATLVRALNNKGMSLGFSGNLEEAYSVFERANEVSLNNLHKHNRYIENVNLGTTAHYLGRYFEAHSRYKLGLSDGLNRQDNYAAVWGLTGLGELLTDLGFLDAARRNLRQAIAYLPDQSIQSRYGELASLGLIRCLRLSGSEQAAIELLGESDFSHLLWLEEYLYDIELAHSRKNLKTRLNELQKSNQIKQHSAIGKFCLEVEALKILLELELIADASDVLLGILDELKELKLHHFLAIEAHRVPSLKQLLMEIEHIEAGVVLEKVTEIIRVGNRFRFVIDDRHKGGRLFQAMGGISVRREDNKNARLRPIHAEVLFYLLEHENISSEQLGEELWPELEPDKQGSNLHSAIYQIRQQLGPEIILTAGGRYRINQEALYAYDAKLFELAASEALLELETEKTYLGSVEEALSLYGGEFLPGYYGDWIINRREELRSDYLDLLIRASSLSISHGNPELSLRRLKSGLKQDPLNERLAEAYLQLLIETGEFQQAISFYRRFEKRLAAELQLRPSRDIRDLIRKLQRDTERAADPLHYVI